MSSTNEVKLQGLLNRIKARAKFEHKEQVNKNNAPKIAEKVKEVRNG